VRGRIEKILAAAKARGLRSRESANPAAWRGHLNGLLPKKKTLARGHHAALPLQDAPGFMAALRKHPALAARCLEFTILTAARSGEALGAEWAGDATEFPREIVEQALAHAVAAATERAYRRGAAVGRRRPLMDA